MATTLSNGNDVIDGENVGIILIATISANTSLGYTHSGEFLTGEITTIGFDSLLAVLISGTIAVRMSRTINLISSMLGFDVISITDTDTFTNSFGVSDVVGLRTHPFRFNVSNIIGVVPCTEYFSMGGSVSGSLFTESFSIVSTVHCYTYLTMVLSPIFSAFVSRECFQGSEFTAFRATFFGGC